jgi:hypothetical protein
MRVRESGEEEKGGGRRGFVGCCCGGGVAIVEVVGLFVFGGQLLVESKSLEFLEFGLVEPGVIDLSNPTIRRCPPHVCRHIYKHDWEIRRS